MTSRYTELRYENPYGLGKNTTNDFFFFFDQISKALSTPEKYQDRMPLTYVSSSSLFQRKKKQSKRQLGSILTTNRLANTLVSTVKVEMVSLTPSEVCTQDGVTSANPWKIHISDCKNEKNAS